MLTPERANFALWYLWRRVAAPPRREARWGRRPSFEETSAPRLVRRQIREVFPEALARVEDREPRAAARVEDSRHARQRRRERCDVVAHRAEIPATRAGRRRDLPVLHAVAAASPRSAVVSSRPPYPPGSVKSRWRSMTSSAAPDESSPTSGKANGAARTLGCVAKAAMLACLRRVLCARKGS